MPEPGTIPDPRQNPRGERSFGIVFCHKDSHYYLYVKNDDGSSSQQSRFFTSGTRVTINNVRPALLVYPKDSWTSEDITNDEAYTDQLESISKDQLMNLKNNLNNCGFEVVSAQVDSDFVPVIVDVVQLDGNPLPNQPVIEKLNDKAKTELKPNQNINKPWKLSI